ncbi:MAG TPA: ABC transporter substrate-binding protein [Chloroflexota bacterium]|nr:ABC transporter substrate-binding protein [Chloroflexota bacterium]
MRSFRLLAAGASALALFVSACSTGGAPSPTAPAAAATTAPAKPTTAAAASPAASPSAAAAAAASPKPAASPAASPAAAVASPSAAASPIAAGGPKPMVKTGSFNFDESVILMELYSQVLEVNGYTIERHPRLGSREIVEPALESAQIDLVPEYLATVEAFLAKTNSKASSDPAATQKALQDLLTPKNITVLDFAQAVDTNGFVVTKATADKNKLAKMSDLQPVAGQLVLGGPPECPQRPFCLLGLQSTYGLQFKDFKPLDAGGPLTVAALDSGDIDVGLLFTTDPAITLKNYVLLDDDKHLQLADNIAPLVRNDILTRGADARSLLNSVTSKLTTADLTDMNKQVGIDHKDAKDVAQVYLKAKSIIP